MRLNELANLYPTDKNFTHNYYNEVYQDVFEPVQRSVVKVCEIGIGGFWPEVGWVAGNSLKVWRDFFSNAEILGLDIATFEIGGDLSRIKIQWFDQSKDEVIKHTAGTLQDYDIIVDDGSHNMHDQQMTFAYFMRSLKMGGFYVLEDLHSSLEVTIPEKCNLWGWGDPTKTTTLSMLEHFRNTGRIVSDYYSEEEVRYLEEHIDIVDIRYVQPTSITSIIRKK